MITWKSKLDSLIRLAVERSSVTNEVRIGQGLLSDVGVVARKVTSSPKALVVADARGFDAAGPAVVAALRDEGFSADTLILPADPLPVASVGEAEPIRATLAADAGIFPVSVGSGVINDCVKYAAFRTDRRYMAVATAASMDGYTSAGASLARDGFKVTIPTRAPVAMIADLDVITAAPPEMNAWGYGDLAGKVPAGGDWILAETMGAEPIDELAWSLVQEDLAVWLEGPEGIASGDKDAIARLFTGLTAVGFAMEAHGSSRPASGAEHQIAHLWEMQGLEHNGRKVPHGAAVAVGCVASLALFDWILEQDFDGFDVPATLDAAPGLDAREAELARAIHEPRTAAMARIELRAKHVERDIHEIRLNRLRSNWRAVRKRLETQLVRREDMVSKLRRAGAPVSAAEIGVSPRHLLETLRAAAFIRRRYTIFDFLHDIGSTEAAIASVVPRLAGVSALEVRK
ncbi:MAG: sn-glycerol-1-phosphate dehydrogenase [Boseongicola sp. SB0675_bin_26]|nr:sn-glycerol-1-phosphate dehydrogenase [Boseongicola sp. SB0675_bin_26]